jgi:peptidoglycan/xylan/chitin deacetylase (PgdA/CDA1 family)
MEVAGPGKVPTVALTLDACGPRTDYRILSALVRDQVPATIFATRIWIRRNPKAIELIRANPSLFEIENHGARHIPAIDRRMVVYGLAAAGTLDAVRQEIQGGADALAATMHSTPHWFRGAGAVYTEASLALIKSMGLSLAGYSIAADGGAAYSAPMTLKRMSGAHDGDVILAHLGKPQNAAGLGVVEGVEALKKRGYRFVKLSEVTFRYEGDMLGKASARSAVAPMSEGSSSSVVPAKMQ